MAVAVMLEIEGTDPVRGRMVAPADGREYAFVGWLAFMRLIVELAEVEEPEPERA